MKAIDIFSATLYNGNRKGKTSNGYAEKFLLKNNSNLFSTSWSYFLFMEYIIKNNNINNVIM